MSMNNIKSICKEIIDYGVSFKESMVNILEKYRKETLTAKQEAVRWESEKMYVEKQQAAADKARDSIRTAEKGFRTNISYALDKYRDELKKTLLGKIDPEFTSTLHLYSDFGVPIGKLELETLIKLANDNVDALTAVNNVLKKTDSDYKLSYKAFSDYENDINALERVSIYPLLVPKEYYVEGAAIYKDMLLTIVRDDLSTVQNGQKIDSLAFIMHEADFKNAMKAIQETISSIEGESEVSTVSTVIEKRQEKLIQDAPDIGLTNAKGNRLAKDGIKELLDN